MKKIIFMMLVLVFSNFWILHAEEADTIAEMQDEENSYEQGEYKAQAEDGETGIRKSEGMDFKAPEILIKGKIDTKVMLKREIQSLENLQDVKNILYEEEKIDMPDYYLKEDQLNPQYIESKANKDFVGKVRFSAGSYSNILADGIIGKAFDKDNSVVMRLVHNNFYNPIVNDRENDCNLNSGNLYYSTKYDELSAAYILKGTYNAYVNPFPYNYFSDSYILGNYGAGLDLSGKLIDTDISFFIRYDYLDIVDSDKKGIYKENRVTNKINLEKDFSLDKEKSVKTILNIGYHAGFVSGMNETIDGTYDAEVLFKGIFYFEPVIFQGGLRMQLYKGSGLSFRVSPYLNVNYDMLSWFSAYLEFDPEMSAPDSFELLKTPFLIPDYSVKPSVENVSLKAGGNINIFEVFFDIYYGYKSINDHVYADETLQEGLFSVFNTQLEYNYFGVSVETIRLKSISFTIDYTHKNILKSGVNNLTDFPEDDIAFKGNFEKAQFEFGAELKLSSSYYGKKDMGRNSYITLNATAGWKITDYFEITGYINNILNNDSYLLYYYKEKGFNLGLGGILNF